MFTCGFLLALATIGALLCFTFELRGRKTLSDADREILRAPSRRHYVLALAGLMACACVMGFVLISGRVLPRFNAAQPIVGLISLLLLPGIAAGIFALRLLDLRHIPISRESKRLFAGASIIAIVTLIGCLVGVAVAMTGK